MLASQLLKRVIAHGTLAIEDAHGKHHKFGGGEGPCVNIKLTDKSLHWKFLVNPGLYIGNAYTDGTLIIQSGTLKDLLEILLISEMRLEGSTASELLRRFKGFIHRKDVINRISKSRQNVQHHYDLSAELYDQFLDSDRQYSCAYFRNKQDDIETAQLNKKQHLASKLLLKPGQKVLDIGCGWGGLAIYIAQHFDVEVTGVTLSDEQLKLAQKRVRQAGLQDKVKIKLLDYRHETEQFDRIVSVGMFEHVGLPHYKEFFEQVERLLKDDGLALIHTIARQTKPTTINEWMRRNIFPGAYLPTLSQLSPIFEQLDLWLTDFENLRLHYAKTLVHWNDRFQTNRNRVKKTYDEKFCRMWEYYLQSCEMGFRHSGLTVFQMQIAKHIDVVPMTRDYIFETEHDMIAQDALRDHRMAGE